MDCYSEEAKKVMDEGAAILKAMGHPVRLLILKSLHLSKCKCNVTKLEEICGISQSGVSQHLRLLRLHGIIEPERDGKQICYQIVSEQALEILAVVCGEITE